MKTEPNSPATGYGFTTANAESHVNESGLTKREYFAAIAMQGLLSNPTICTPDSDFNVIKETSVLIADYLIAELNRPQPNTEEK